jgi:hypothetical protein
MVHRIVLKIEKIWLRYLKYQEKKGHNLWTVNVKYTIIKLNLYFMVYSIVLKFEKIWLSGTLNIIRKPKKVPIF